MILHDKLTSTVLCMEKKMTHVTARSHPEKNGKWSNRQMLKHVDITPKSLNKQISRFAGLLVFFSAQPLLLESTCDANLASHAYHPVFKPFLNAGLSPDRWMFFKVMMTCSGVSEYVLNWLLMDYISSYFDIQNGLHNDSTMKKISKWIKVLQKSKL